MTALRAGALVFVAVILQVALFASTDVLGGTPDLLLVTLISLALLRGSIAGAAAGFAGGLLVDVATLGTLGVTSLLLTLAGYWAGRYGETTGRERRYAPLLAVLVITVLVAVGGYLLHYMLGEDVSAERALLATLLPGIALNAILTEPVYRLCRRLLGPAAPPSQRVPEMELG